MWFREGFTGPDAAYRTSPNHVLGAYVADIGGHLTDHVAVTCRLCSASYSVLPIRIWFGHVSTTFAISQNPLHHPMLSVCYHEQNSNMSVAAILNTGHQLSLIGMWGDYCTLMKVQASEMHYCLFAFIQLVVLGYVVHARHRLPGTGGKTSKPSFGSIPTLRTQLLFPQLLHL